MSAIRDIAGDVADDLADDGVVVIPRHEVNGRVGDHDEVSRVDHDEIRAAFEDRGWRYARHLYLRPDGLREAAETLAATLREDRHLVVTEEEVVEEVADPVSRGDEEGWRRGELVSILRDAFEDDGWLVRHAERSTGGDSAARTFYLLPLSDVVYDLHPNGRHPFSTDEILTYYVSQSLEAVVTGE